jgi:tetratricopeptide (TPR) repeat protein
MSLERDELELSSDLRQAAAELTRRFEGCPEPALLQSAEAAVLPAEINARVIRHIEGCTVCKSLAQDLARLDEAPLQEQEKNRIWSRIQAGITVETLPSPAELGRPRRWSSFFRPWPTTAWAAAAALVGVLLVIGFNLMRQHPQPVASLQPQEAPPSQTSEPRPGQSPASPLPSRALALEKPPVTLPASAVMVWRGQAEAGNDQLKALKEALIPYSRDDYAEAKRRLESVAREYPRLAEAQFYLGVCELFLNQNQDAAVSLKRARVLAHQPLTREADWYLALAYHRSGQDGEVRPLLEKLCHTAGKDSARACAGLVELSTPQ